MSVLSAILAKKHQDNPDLTNMDFQIYLMKLSQYFGNILDIDGFTEGNPEEFIQSALREGKDGADMMKTVFSLHDAPLLERFKHPEWSKTIEAGIRGSPNLIPFLQDPFFIVYLEIIRLLEVLERFHDHLVVILARENPQDLMVKNVLLEIGIFGNTKFFFKFLRKTSLDIHNEEVKFDIKDSLKFIELFIDFSLQERLVKYLKENNINETMVADVADTSISLHDWLREYLLFIRALYFNNLESLGIYPLVHTHIDANVVIPDLESGDIGEDIMNMIKAHGAEVVRYCLNRKLIGYMSPITIPLIIEKTWKRIRDLPRIRTYFANTLHKAVKYEPLNTVTWQCLDDPDYFFDVIREATDEGKQPTVFKHEYEDFLQYINLKQAMDGITDKDHQFLITNNIADFHDVSDYDPTVLVRTPLHFLIDFARLRLVSELRDIKQTHHVDVKWKLGNLFNPDMERLDNVYQKVHILLAVLTVLNDEMLDKDEFTKKIPLPISKLNVNYDGIVPAIHLKFKSDDEHRVTENNLLINIHSIVNQSIEAMIQNLYVNPVKARLLQNNESEQWLKHFDQMIQIEVELGENNG